MRHARSTKPRTGREGVALLYAVLASFVAASLVTLMIGISLVTDRAAELDVHRGMAQSLTDGAVEAAKKVVQTAIANWDAVPTQGTVTIDGTAVAYRVRPTGFTSTATDASGLQTLLNGYEIHAAVSVRGVRAQSYRVIHASATPLFQYAAFYTRDLEINPGPNMSLGGRVHTNRDLYLGSNNTLTLNTNYVRAVGGVYRNRKDDPTASTGTVTIRKWVVNPWDATEPAQYVTMSNRAQLSSAGVPSQGGYDSHFQGGYDAAQDGDFTDPGDLLPWGPGAQSYWGEPAGYAAGSGHTVQSSDHGVREAVVPTSGSIAMFEPRTGGDWTLDPLTNQYVRCAPGTGNAARGFYHQHADLSILAASDGLSFKAYDSSGADVTAAVSAAIALKPIYDARQANGGAGTTRVLDVDVQALAATGKFPANGLLYAAHYGALTGTAAKGVRLRNGAVLPRKLTVASEDPIYIQGDYNVGDATHPKLGAAVIGDAVNLLSNAWNDTKTSTSGLPSAADTTYNVAIVSGNQDTSVGHYNGGFENLPRFHENWTGKTATIKGSMVCTWLSEHATSPWVYGGNRYQAPNRNWSYDTAFNNVLNLPPFTPIAVSARDVVSW